MSGYRLSSHVVPDHLDRAVLRQTYTNERLKPGPALRGVIDELLSPHSPERNDGERALSRLVALDLVERGFLVPDEVADEERFLDAIRPLKYNDRLFDLPRAYLDDLPGAGDAVVFGVPCDLGADNAGTSNGPSLLRKASSRFGWRGRAGRDAIAIGQHENPFAAMRARDLGDVRLSQRDLAAWLDVVEQVVAKVAEGDVPVMLGGDHVFTLAAIRGLWRARGGKPFTLLQFDQHLDMQFQGAFEDGQPTRLRPPAHHNFMSHIRAISPDIRIVQIGIDHYQCAGAGAREDTLRYLDTLGERVSDLQVRTGDFEGIAALIGRDQDVYITLDVDVFPREFISCTGFPAALGVPFERIFELLRTAVAANRVIGMDVMEFGVTEPNRDAVTNAEAYRIDLLLAQLLEWRSRS